MKTHTIARCEGSEKSARAATTIFIHNGAPQTLACEFRHNLATDSDLMPAGVPI
jgi:hypothetical protein